MRHYVITKAINCLLSIIFLTTSTAYSVPQDLLGMRGTQAATADNTRAAIAATIDPAKLTIPENFGTITERFTSAGNENSKKLIIQIQDSHCNYEAQSNIMKIVETLSKDRETAAACRLIATEGAQGALDPTFMRSFPDDKIREEASDYFMRIGWLTGTEMYSINFKDEPIPLWGIEDKALYDENLACFKQAKTGLVKEKELVEKLSGLIDVLKLKVFSKDVGELVRKRDDWDKGVMTFTGYCSYIEKVAREQGFGEKGAAAFRDPVRYPNLTAVIGSLEIERKIDAMKTGAERKALIDELQKKMVKEELSEMVKQSLYLRTGKCTSDTFYAYLKSQAASKQIEMTKYPNLAGYIDIAIMSSRVNATATNDEIDRLERVIKNKMFVTEEERDLDELSARVKVLKKLLELRMSRSDISFYGEHKKEMAIGEIVARFNKIALSCGGNAIPAGALGDAISFDLSPCERFYDAALKRDAVLVEKTIDEMGKRDATAVTVVTGGFHTQGLKELFKKKGYSYVVVMPRMTRKYDDKIYLSRMLDEQSEFDKLFAHTGNRLAAWTMLGSMKMGDAYILTAFIKAIHGGKDINALKERWMKIIDASARLSDDQKNRAKKIVYALNVRKTDDGFFLELTSDGGVVTRRRFAIGKDGAPVAGTIHVAEKVAEPSAPAIAPDVQQIGPSAENKELNVIAGAFNELMSEYPQYKGSMTLFFKLLERTPPANYEVFARRIEDLLRSPHEKEKKRPVPSLAELIAASTNDPREVMIGKFILLFNEAGRHLINSGMLKLELQGVANLVVSTPETSAHIRLLRRDSIDRAWDGATDQYALLDALQRDMFGMRDAVLEKWSDRYDVKKMRDYAKEYMKEKRKEAAATIKKLRGEHYATKKRMAETEEEIKRTKALSDAYNASQKKMIDLAVKIGKLHAKINAYGYLKRLLFKESILQEEQELARLESLRRAELKKLDRKSYHETRLAELEDARRALSQDIDGMAEANKLLKEHQEKRDSAWRRYLEDSEREWKKSLMKKEADQSQNQISAIANKHHVVFVHGIVPSGVRGSISKYMNTTVGIYEKVKILESLKPDISASTVTGKRDNEEYLWGSCGILLKAGEVRGAYTGDAGSVCEKGYINKRISGYRQSSVEDAIASSDYYNEFIVAKPEAAGFFVNLDCNKESEKSALENW